MSHIHLASVNKVLEAKLTRTCPACHKQQKVLKEYEKETVACHNCGGSIPPKQEGH